MPEERKEQWRIELTMIVKGDSLPRIVMRISFKPHLKESHLDYNQLLNEMPKFTQMLERYTWMAGVGNNIVDFIS